MIFLYTDRMNVCQTIDL